MVRKVFKTGRSTCASFVGLFHYYFIYINLTNIIYLQREKINGCKQMQAIKSPSKA